MPYKNKKDGYKNQMKRWHRHKQEAIRYKGNKCSDCGIEYNGKNAVIFDFHHLSPDEKEYSWSKLRLRNKESRILELNKCILLCANCHRLRHGAEH